MGGGDEVVYLLFVIQGCVCVCVCVCVRERERESRQDREKEHVLGLFEVHKICSVSISSAFNQPSFIVM